jgi:lipopolysaccharide/colanic/teichoic acid biosynthesis glycosyltransferase
MGEHLILAATERASLLVRIREERLLYLACKRVFDFWAASGLLILLSPLMATIALLIALDSPGPIIFRQRRVGWKRRPQEGETAQKDNTFIMFKFRTMYMDADSDVHRTFIQAYVQNDQERMAELQNGNTEACKLVEDPRVTPLGSFLRRSSLDELPQLWNVVKGDMSLVGPRPDVTYSVEEYQPWHFERLAVKPGLTCLWQACGRSSVSFDDWIRMDIEYVRNRSFWLDLKILFLTIPAVLRGRGAV